jgi:NADH:ubiquinone oxidoreductase subunit 3 (subunit A)
LKKDENLINIRNKNYDKKDDDKDKNIDKDKEDETNKKKEDNKNYNKGNENKKDIVDINEIYKEIETKKNENNYIDKNDKEDQIKNRENDSLDYSSNQIWKYIIYGLIFIIFSISLILLGMFIQRRCFDSQRKKRLNELEEEINETEMKNKENINKDDKEDQIKNREYDSLNYNCSNQFWKYIIYGLIFIIFSVSLILLGMLIQRRCFDSKRIKRSNELEEEINETERQK